ncbi:MAG TPA: hypothetical protein VFW07_21360 [Parafilimonas sp.]|nr:hypothetical protein [Parafilimonas sp.]
MKTFFQKQLFALVLGLIDGILTVLTLATGKVLTTNGESFSLSLALRVAFVTAISGSFVYFISEYSRQRNLLIHAEKELNLASHGKLAVSNLGKQILKQTWMSVIVSGSFSFLGAFIPISGAVFFPGQSWLSIVIALLILALLGFSVAKLVYGNTFLWMITLVCAGIAVSFIGYKLHVI